MSGGWSAGSQVAADTLPPGPPTRPGRAAEEWVVMSRRKVAVIVIVAVVLSSLGGWVAASRMRSPAEIAARTAPPSPSAVLVPAEMRTISSDVVTRGTARFGSPQRLTTVPSALKASPGIITEVPVVGTELREGDVLLAATGRPVFLLAGARLGV